MAEHDRDEQYMQRCIELAQKGAGHVAPNPMVGAVLVYKDRIIGEGYHQVYGQAHAEVNCIAAVREEDRHFIALSTMYVSLEPCAHMGKTPPCADLIIRHTIKDVRIGCRDPFPLVDGAGIEKLLAAGVRVKTGILEKECRALNKRFITFYQQRRPYVILKWAQTADGFIAGAAGSDRLMISNAVSNRLVHKWRSQEASILVGTQTALLDDPALTTRLWEGASPVRLVIDKELRLPTGLKLFDSTAKTIVFNMLKHGDKGNVVYYQLTNDSSTIHQVLLALYQLKVQSVIVEGGARLLQSFIDEGCWDETRIIINTQLHAGTGLPAPMIKGRLKNEERFDNDMVQYFESIQP